MPRWLTAISVSLLLALFGGTLAFAQRDLGTVTGTVTDPSGAAVPNAKVTILNVATNVAYDTVTNASGVYSRPALTPGTYSVTVEAAGFQRAQQPGIIVAPGEPVSVNITLKVGNATETVVVEATAPLLQTESPALGETLNSGQVSEFPLAVSAPLLSWPA